MINPLSTATRFLRRSHTERKLMVHVTLLFVAAHWLLHRHTLEEARIRLQRLASKLGTRADPQEISWAIDRVDAHLPGTHTCLIHALCCDAAAHASNIPIDFRIGATSKGSQHRFHAWVEHDGVALTGEDHAGFAPMV